MDEFKHVTGGSMSSIQANRTIKERTLNLACKMEKYLSNPGHIVRRRMDVRDRLRDKLKAKQINIQ